MLLKKLFTVLFIASLASEISSQNVIVPEIGKTSPPKPQRPPVTDKPITTPKPNLPASLLSADSKKTQEAYTKSILSERKKDYKSAIQEITDVYNEKDYFTNLRLGWLHYLDSNHQRSIEYYTKAVNIQPNAIEPKLGLTFPLNASGKKDELIKQYETVLKLDPNNAKALYFSGLFYYNQKQYDKSKPLLEKLISLYPSDTDSYALLGWVNLMLEEKDEARTNFERALIINARDRSANEGLKKLK